MGKHIWFVATMALCLQCGGAPPPAVEEPAATPAEETTPSTQETPSETPSAEDTAPATDNGSQDAVGAKKKCEELDKSTCKVTVGCGWNDLKKCVEAAPSESR